MISLKHRFPVLPLVEGIFRFRWMVLASILALTAGLSVGAVFLKFDADPRGYFNKSNPERLLLEEFEKQHGRESSAVLMLVPNDGNIFSDALLNVVKQAVSSLSAVPGVKRVNSAADTGVQSGSALKAIWDQDPQFLRPLMSKKGGVSAVVAFLDPTKADLLAAVDEIKTIKSSLESFHPAITFRLSGEAPMDATFMEAIEQDIIWLAPLQVALIIVLLLVCLQSVRATIILLVVLGCATGITMGTAGWLGYQLNGVTSAAPMILLGIAVATCIHLLIAWQQDFRTHRDSARALASSIETNAFPVFLATLSTVSSFLCLNFSDSPPFQQLGNLIAMGLTVTWVLAFTLLPALVLMFPPAGASRRIGVETEWLHLGRCVIMWRKSLLVVLCVAAVGSVWGLTKLSFDDRFSQYFSERFEFRRDTDFMEKNLTGLNVLHFPLETGELSPGEKQRNREMALAFASWLDEQPEIARVDGFASAVKLAKANGLPDEVYDKIRPVITAVLSNASSAEIRTVAERSNSWLGTYTPTLSKGAVGTALLAANLSERNLDAMVIGTIAALILVSCILLFSLGSVRLGIISLIPNLLPMLLAYGFWGHVLGEMSFAATVVMALTFGIIVDDTVHFLAKYNRYRKHYGFGVEWAIAESFRTVGIAITATTFAIASGFLALCFSGFLVNHHLGLLTLMILFAAWLSVLFLLPPLLVYLDKEKPPG